MVSLYFFCHHIDFCFEFFVDVFGGFYVDFFVDLREVSDRPAQTRRVVLADTSRDSLRARFLI